MNEIAVRAVHRARIGKHEHDFTMVESTRAKEVTLFDTGSNT